MPDIKKLSVEQVEGGRIVTVSAFVPNKQDLEQDDLVEIERVVFEAGTVGVKPAGEAPAETGRRRRGAEPAEEAPAGEAPAETGRRRRGAGSASASDQDATSTEAPSGSEGRRRRSAPAEEPKTEAPTEGRRRRGAAPAEEKPKISDADLTKAGQAALAALIKEGENKSDATKFILDILGEFKNAKGQPCDNVSDLQGDDRQAFLDELKKEKLL